MDAIKNGVAEARATAQTGLKHARAVWARMDHRHRIALVAATVAANVLIILALVYHAKLLALLVEFSQWWRSLRFGWLILFMLLVMVAFPPLIGYSALSNLAGMAYGFPGGWPLLASGTVIGSFISFLAFRYLLRDRAQRLASTSTKFAALTHTLEQSTFTLLWLIRLCPLPYSLSNGALASIPSVKPWAFLVATACTTPKLFIHVFVGDRLARMGTEKDTASKIVDLISILLASFAGIATTYIIYTRTMALARAMDAQDYTELDMELDRDFDVSDDSDAVSLEESGRPRRSVAFA